MRVQTKSVTFSANKNSARPTADTKVHEKHRSGLICTFSALTVAAAVSNPSTTLAAETTASGTTADERRSVLGEVVVTATKRETNLQKTAAAVSVISADTIEKIHLVGMEDYFAALPGVSYQDRGAGSNTITIRGIALGSQLDPNSPVGSYFGEVPVTGLGPPLNGNQAGNADIKLVDIQRVEVLRGPQGTLYGSGTMGGTVRIIPNAPNLQEVEGRIATEYSRTGRNGGNNYMAQAVVNAPLVEDKLAVRMAAYRFDNDGFINNVAVSQPDAEVTAAVNAGAIAEDRNHVGADVYTGVRVTGLWRPTSNFSATLSYMNQEIAQDGHKEVETNLQGDYLQTRVKVGTFGLDDEYVNLELDITNLLLEYDLGWGSFLNSTSYVNSEGASDIELSFFGPPFVGEGALNTNDKELSVNEFRFTSAFDGPFQILAGLYYEDRTNGTDLSIRWTGRAPAPVAAFTQSVKIINTQKQLAGFGELSYHPFEPLTLTVGARYFKFDQAVPLSRSRDVPTAAEGRSATVKDSSFKFNVSYELSEQLFAYALWSQGFREPRFQGIVIPEFDADNDGLVEFQDGIERKVTEGLLDPDTVDNYEVGIKFRSNNGRLQGSLTGFLIDWEGIPIVPSLTAHLGAALFFNAGKAESKGIEFEAAAELIDDLIFELSASWVDATLVGSVVGLGVAGADIPGSADYNVKAALEKQFVVGGHDSFVRADYTYVSEYFGTFQETAFPAGDYDLVDLSAGVSFDKINIGLFVKNVANADDITWVDNIFKTIPTRAYRLRPRTVGVSVSASF